jgi:hypothetical protein
MKPIEIHTLHPTGFPVTFIIEAADPKLHTLIQKLVNLGYRPGIAGDTWARTPEGLPICPRHSVVMPRREKQGDTWYSHKVTDPTTGEVTYCRGYPHSSSTGFSLPEPEPQPEQTPVTVTNGNGRKPPNNDNTDPDLDELNNLLYN